ncbi:MAG TPA: YceI family protein [Chloroflexota bacterium]|jgi:polyisoprenoid-binding protein YceI
MQAAADTVLGIAFGIALPLVVGGFLAGLFTYFFERRLSTLDRRERKGVLLESLKRELSFIPAELPAYRAELVSFLPPIRTVAGAQLLDGQTLDWKTDAGVIQALLELLGAASIYNALAEHLNTNQGGAALAGDARRHWHGQMLGAHASVVAVRREILTLLDGSGDQVADDPGAVGGLATAPSSIWSVDTAHSSLRFSAVHMGIINVHGRFTDAQVRLDLDAQDLTRTSVEVVVTATSIDTDEPRRDADLRSERFLNAAQYPHLTFISTSVVRRDTKAYDLVGDLTIRDVTRPVTLDVKTSGTLRDSAGTLRIGLTAQGTIRRSDWGLTWNLPLDSGGWLVSDEVTIEIDLQAVRSPAAEVAPEALQASA